MYCGQSSISPCVARWLVYCWELWLHTHDYMGHQVYVSCDILGLPDKQTNQQSIFVPDIPIGFT